MTAINEVVIEIAGVRHVEVPRDHEGLCRVVRTTDIGMATAAPELTRGAVAEVSDEDLTAEIEVLFERDRIPRIKAPAAFKLA